MEFRIADSFTAALTKLTRDGQKAVKTSVFDRQTNPEHPGLQLRRIDVSKDPNFWSCRVSRDIHLAKGLEFKAAAVIGCDEDQLPLRSRVEAVADEVELDDVYATERHLLYVACTRARDRLAVSGIKPGSEFLGDLRAQ